MRNMTSYLIACSWRERVLVAALIWRVDPCAVERDAVAESAVFAVSVTTHE